MSKWNNFCKNVRQLTEKAIKKTEELTDVAALHVKIKTLEGKISEQYENLGVLTYSSAKSGSDNKETVTLTVSKIDSYLADIAAYKLKLSQIEAESKKAKTQKSFPCTNQSENESVEQLSDTAGSPDKNGETDFPVLSEDEDPKLEEAIRIVVENQKVSTSLLQRKLEVGYGRAVKLIERMEELGVVGAADGNKPRKVLIEAKESAKAPISDEDTELDAAENTPVQPNPFSLPFGGEDEKLTEAIELAFSQQKISTSMLQRHLGIGYGRSAKLIDRMEELGWISAPCGNAPRAVVINSEQLEAVKNALS